MTDRPTIPSPGSWGHSSGATPPGPTPRRGWGWLVLAFGVVVIIVAGAALLAVVLDRDPGPDTSEHAGGSSTVVVPAGPTVEPRPTSTVPPPATLDPMVVAQADATAAVDRYLAAGDGRDEHVFAAVWAYPIEDRYGTKGQDEAQLRTAARAYWDRYPTMEFRRVGPTTLTRSASGWETSTPYAFEGSKQDGTATCGTTTLYLGFTDQWLVRTANEDKPTRTC